MLDIEHTLQYNLNMTANTKNGFSEIDNLIENEKRGAPKTFPYTTRELAAKFGMSNSTVSLYLRERGLVSKGRRWFYRSIEEREHE